MRNYLLILIGILFASIGYNVAFNGADSLKWVAAVIYLVAATCFIVQATFMIKKRIWQ